MKLLIYFLQFTTVMNIKASRENVQGQVVVSNYYPTLD
jgi:hypothetical protein